MRDETPSKTAAWVAAARQLGRLLPDDLRLADDRYGAEFTSAGLASVIERAVSPGPKDNSADGWLRQLRHPIAFVPGLSSWVAYMQVRTRVIDDALRRFVAEGGRQLVLLGAGYDCRALRMPELSEVRVFEVDHPATQAHKQAVLARCEATSPATYVTWDFEARPVDELPDALVAAGLDAAAPTFTIWEGVTMYLSEPAIDASLRAIARWSPPRSTLAMTYFARTRIEEPSWATKLVAAVVSTLGEPWRWGWKPEELSGYLAARGLALVDDVAIADAARELWPPELSALVADPERRVAFARTTPESIAFATTAGAADADEVEPDAT
jgi:methyltransferase (TIGR00027 family)